MTTITIVGNLIADPEIRFTPSGKAVANCTIAVNNRTKNDAGEWEDGDPDFYNVTIWDRDGAEHVADSLSKGMRVIVQGDYKSRRYETKDGDKRTAWDLTARAIGPDLRWATAQVTKAGSNNGGQGSQQGYQSQTRTNTQQRAQQAPQARQQPPADPWGGQDLSSYEPAPF